jgi:hypothetical protein
VQRSRGLLQLQLQNAADADLEITAFNRCWPRGDILISFRSPLDHSTAHYNLSALLPQEAWQSL